MIDPLDAKTMWQRVDEVCKLGAFKVEPYEECTGKDQLPETPEGATSVQCEKKRCWPICEDGESSSCFLTQLWGVPYYKTETL